MLEKFIDAAMRRTECDLVLKNATYLDVFSGKLRCGDIAIKGDKIVGIGEYSSPNQLDLSDLIVLPAFIDGHVHIESSQLSPEEFAALIVPRGVTAVIADPHEITNVCGFDGCDYIATASKNVPLDVFLQLPSCVPATPYETSGAILSGEDVEKYILSDNIFGLGEFMNYVGVINAEADVVKKLEAAHRANKIIDGHAPSVTGYQLNAYLCGGISTCHECLTSEEIDEKISKGMYIHIRHGSTTHNLENAKCMNGRNMRRFLLCTDDRHAADIREKGHIDSALKSIVEMGVDPVWAVTAATLSVAECYGLKYRGAIAPFYLADLAVVDNLKSFNVKYVLKSGKLAAKDGKPLFDSSNRHLPSAVLNTVHLKKMTADDFVLKLRGDTVKAIIVKSGSIVTGCERVSVNSSGGDVDLKGTDLLKIAVVERHKMTGNVGRAILKGYGFKGGAIGTTVAHDSHNIILLGDDNAAMAAAANRLKEIGGGMVIVESSGAIHSVTLDIGGLMSSKSADKLIEDLSGIIRTAHKMGVREDLQPFMSLAFMSLAVIPELKLLDKGLFDVLKFEFTDLEEG